MPEPTTLKEPIQQLLDDALRPTFGELLPEYYAEVERHQNELREIPKRFVSGFQLAFRRAYERAVAYGSFPGDEAGFRVHAELEDLRGGQDAEIHAALLAEHENHRRNVEDLKRRAKGE